VADAVAPREGLSYEQARDKLAAVVKRLEAGGLTLEQSLELWERGERLAAVCEEWLDGARARLAAAMAKRDASAVSSVSSGSAVSAVSAVSADSADSADSAEDEAPF
jgi:exodeoxyribonuclease VII small subunit